MVWSCHPSRHQLPNREVMELEITRKRKKGRPRKSWEECVKKDLERYGLKREDAYDREKWREQIKAKTANPASRDNGIKTDVVVVAVIVVVSKPLSKPSYYFFLQLCIKDFFSLSRSSSEMRKKMPHNALLE